MLRISVVRAARLASRPAIARISGTTSLRILGTFARFESTQPPPSVQDVKAAALKTARKEKDKLNHNWDATILTYDQVKPKTTSPSPDAYLIDVREPDEVIQGSIPSSVNLPLSVLSNSLHLSRETFKEKHGFDKPKHGQEIVFYCRSGKRSASACDIAKRNGYTNLLNYEGSWLDWVAKEGTPSK